MKYKNIKAMAHNFAHSFLSYMNYVDEGYVVNDILDYVRQKKPNESGVVQFFPIDKDKDAVFSNRVRKSLSYYREHFPKHCESHKVDLSAIKSIDVQIVKNSSHQILGYVRTTDDNGKDYEQYVSF